MGNGNNSNKRKKNKHYLCTHYVPYSHVVLNPTAYVPIFVSVNAVLLQPPEIFRKECPLQTLVIYYGWPSSSIQNFLLCCELWFSFLVSYITWIGIQAHTNCAIGTCTSYSALSEGNKSIMPSLLRCPITKFKPSCFKSFKFDIKNHIKLLVHQQAKNINLLLLMIICCSDSSKISLGVWRILQK